MTPADALRRRPLTARWVRGTVLAAAVLACGIAPAAAAPSPPTSPSSPATAPSPPSLSAGARAAASGAASFGIGPADGKRVDGRPYLSYLTSPGARLTDHVAVVNLARATVTLNLYAVDAAVGYDGSFGYLAKAATRSDASRWITAVTPGHRPTITLPARTTIIIPVTITVPADAPPGDHAAGVITSLTSKVRSDKGELIDFEQRVALRTFIRVSGPLHPSLAIERLRTHYVGNLNPAGGGTVTITYSVHNIGNVRLGAHQQVIISGVLGTKRPANSIADVALLLPGSAVNVSVTVHGVLPQVRMRARVVLLPLTVAGDVDPGVPSSFTSTTSFWAVPWALILILAALLLVAMGVLVWRRRRKRRPPAGPPTGRHRDAPIGPDGSGGDSDPAAVPQHEGAQT